MEEAKARMAPPGAFEAAQPDASALLERPEDGFVSALSIVLIPSELREGRRVAAIARPFGFVKTLGQIRVAVVAPARYETDFASIPPFARWLISPFGRHAEAAVIHDWLYAIGEPGDRQARKTADRAFRMALRSVRVGFFVRSIMHWSVRLAGGGSFGQPSEFRFRRLGDLSLIEPPPDRMPYLRTVAVKSVPKRKRRGSQAAS